MTFSNTKSIRERANDIYIDDIKIDTVNKITFLGLIINNTLNWSAHIKYMCSKISKNIGIMKKVKNKQEKRLLLNLYYMLIYPYLTYCNTIWGRAPNVYLDKTYILQKTIVRIINHVGFFDHTEPLFSTLQKMNIYQINKYMCCILMFKHNKAMSPTLFNDVYCHPRHINIAQGKNLHIKYRSAEQSVDNYLWRMSYQKYGTSLS